MNLQKPITDFDLIEQKTTDGQLIVNLM